MKRCLGAGALIALVLQPCAAQGPEPLRGADFVGSYRGYVGDRVLIVDCFVAGTTSAFIRCETPDGRSSYTLENQTLDREDLEMLKSTCSTGNRDNPRCRFSVTGRVRRGSMPSLDDAKLGPFRRRP